MVAFGHRALSGLIAPRAHNDNAVAWILLSATVALMAFYYFGRADVIGVTGAGRDWSPMTMRPVAPVYHYLISGVLLGVIPITVARLVTGRPFRELGLGIGRWREGLVWLLIGIPVAIFAGRIGAANETMRAVYPLARGAIVDQFALYAGLQFLYYGAWEVLFRGALLFGLAQRIGPRAANAVQTMCSVLAHFGRALNETAAALPAGLLFGWIGLRLRSVWYVAVMHWTVGISMDWHILAGS